MQQCTVGHGDYGKAAQAVSGVSTDVLIHEVIRGAMGATKARCQYAERISKNEMIPKTSWPGFNKYSYTIHEVIRLEGV